MDKVPHEAITPAKSPRVKRWIRRNSRDQSLSYKLTVKGVDVASSSSSSGKSSSSSIQDCDEEERRDQVCDVASARGGGGGQIRKQPTTILE